MAKQICEFCGKEFNAKPSAHRKYCSKACSSAAIKGKPQPKRVDRVKVKCAICGKEEEVLPSRAEKYLCCSIECLSKYNSKKYSKKVTIICPVCGKQFEVKPSRVKRSKNICCSLECSNKLRETNMLGENNHQFGLKGHLNTSFKENSLLRWNHEAQDILLYKPERPDSDKYGRIKEHRLKILENYDMFDDIFFITDNGFKVFNPELDIQVHHINSNHLDNDINNLIPLTRSTHRGVHNKLNDLAIQCVNKIIGVVKRGELLETPEVDNQQPSLSSNTLEGSETNSRILTDNAEDSNANTSALLNNIYLIIDDYIVQTRNIAEDGYYKTINEILESGIKRPELIQK